MSYMNDYCTEENEIIYIDGREEELIPGLNDIMRKMMEIYIDNYMDPDFYDGLEDNETITIDLTALSEEEMRELIDCTLAGMKLEIDESRSDMLLS